MASVDGEEREWRRKEGGGDEQVCTVVLSGLDDPREGEAALG